MLEGYGIVAVKRQHQRMIPSVKATDFKVEFGLNLSQFDKSGGRSVASVGGL
jgi:predicted transcriptional regulator